MRVIAGQFKSRKLKTLTGDTTRPTSDRLKEALFNQLGPYFDSGLFLDVFAGSGAMSFEALSRGMRESTLIEKDVQAFKIIKENIRELELESKTHLLKGDAQVLIKTLKTQYDIIFVDPPYEYAFTEAIIEDLQRLLNNEGKIIVETRKNKDLPNHIASLVKTKEKTYGMAKVHIYEMSE